MKERVTYTLDPMVSHAARQMARRLGMSASAFVENLIRQKDRSVVQESPAKTISQEWRGKIKLIRDRNDPRARRLFDKYGV
jgi:hypothetical protein